MSRRYVLLAGTVAVAAAALGAAQLLPGAAPAAHADGLVGYSSCTELLDHYRGELRRSATAYGVGFGVGGFAAADSVSESVGGAARSSADAGTAAVGSGPTGTNLQEQGVDEPDLVKLRDGRLVVLTGHHVRVVSAEAQPRLLGSLAVSDDTSYGGELLLVGDRALAVVPGFRADPQPGPASDASRSMVYRPGTPTTRLVLVDLSTGQPRLLEEATYDAQYVSARLVDGTVRLVTTTRPQPPAVYPLTEGREARQEALAANRSAAGAVGLFDVLPQVLRTAPDGTVLERGSVIGCDRVTHARSPRGASTLMVTTLRPATGLEATDSTGVTTDGDIVYASTDRLYVATSRWGTVGPVQPMDGRGRASGAFEEVTTELHGFDTSSSTATRYLGSGSVPGYVLGRWALSSYEGALRVATTRQPPWESERAGDTSSMVVKLAERDGALVETGRVEGLGRTEHIRAVRYFGDLAAVVTFRQTDPLYLLDLSGTPRVLGELKIPGFSTYLHPIGDSLLLGVGQDADQDGRVTGMQVSVFDISDLSRPAQVDRLPLGPGWSPALDDSRAFSYDPARRLATLPFMGYDESAGESSSAVGVSVDSEGRLRERGRLDLDRSWSPRVVLAGEHVFAVTEGGVVAGDADTMTRTGSVTFGPTPDLPLPVE